MKPQVVRIGSASAAWGDSIDGARQLVEEAQIEYLVGDYLAEVTMALLSRRRARDPQEGYVPDWLAAMQPLLPRIAEQGIKLVTNAGGMHPEACRAAFAAAAREAGVRLRVATIQGDDLLPREATLRAQGWREMSTDAPLPESLSSINAYLGARPIADALAAGADVVITGRCVDSALVLGILMHEFGWQDDNYDQLAGGSLAGHIIECSTQCTGGLFTDWELVEQGWSNMGFPVVECAADGTFVVTKPAGTGGLVCRGGVAEQMVYEIGDPASYQLPDVSCDFRQVCIEDTGEDRVRVSGARGRPPNGNYKVCTTWVDGYRLMSTCLIVGADADRKARRVARALIERCERLMHAQGWAPFRETSVEVFGAESSYGDRRRVTSSREVILKIAVAHDDRSALSVFAREFAVPVLSMAPGISGLLGGRPKAAPRYRIFSFLIPKTEVPVAIELDNEIHCVAMPAPVTTTDPAPLELIPEQPPPENSTAVPLRALAWGRSGDKGDMANIGIIPRTGMFAPYIKSQLDAARVGRVFAHWLEGSVTRYELPGIQGFNFVLERVLGGGGTASLRYDPLAKTFAQILLDEPIRVPGEWVAPDGTVRQTPPAAMAPEHV